MKNKASCFKVAVIGAGNVGAATAYVTTIKNLAAEVVLIDQNEEKEHGEILDIADGLCFVDTGCVKGADYKDARDADVIVITAGAKQNKDETRLDLLEKNKKILKSIFKQIGKLKKTAVVIIISNPVDILTYIAQKIIRLPQNQIFGSGTSLDSARLKTEIAHHLKVSAQNIHGYVLGEHGDSEFVAWSTVSVGSKPAKELEGFNIGARKKIEAKVRKEVYEIIASKGATFYGIATAVSEIIEAIFYNQHKIIPVSTRLKNWNGIDDVCLGAPAVIGRSGIEKVWDLKLEADEKKKLKRSADTIKSYIKKAKI